MLVLTTWLCFLFLRVAEYHTYFVGAKEWGFSVWAHNAYKSASEAEQAKKDARLADFDELDAHDWEFYNGHAKEGHHTIPREIQAKLPPSVANHPDVKGRPGLPNIRKIPTSKHIEIHDGPGGGIYNQRFEQEIMNRGGYLKVKVKDILEIRDQLVMEFGL